MSPVPKNFPDHVGPYRLIEVIGEGGMGIVFKAEQCGAIRRTVALKLIKAGMDSKQVIARFEAERQALAIMDHAGIATVHEAGTTDEGRPYFVMEHVKGLPITEFCANHQLPLNQRLRLFSVVCEAVQHAHQKGIIHRDLKPGNILVVQNDQGFPVPKIIDFGIAKAMQTPLTERTLVTNFSQVMGSPAYMSPEQADLSGTDVDTRTDIYALGVLLYELVTGHLPFDRERFASAAFAEIQRLLWEEEPPRPSKRLTSIGPSIDSISAAQSTTSAKLLESIEGDLDWIIMRAIDKDRTRRYASANGFAEDVERFLNHEPVTATPPSAGYLMRKFVKRHRSGVITASLVGCLLVATTAFSVRQAIRATQAEEREAREKQTAQVQAAIATETVDFLRFDLLDQASPNTQPDPDIRLRTVLDRAAESLNGRFEDQPMVKANLLVTVGQTYMGIGEFELATTFLKQGRELSLDEYGEDHARILFIDSNLGDCLAQERRYDEALELRRRIYERRTEIFGPEAATTLTAQTYYGSNLMRLGRVDESIKLLEDATDIWKSKDEAFLQAEPKQRSLRRWITLGVLGDAYLKAGQFELSEKTLKRALDGMQQEFGADSPSTLVTMGNYAASIANQGRLEEAMPVLEETLTRSRRVLGNRSPKVLRLIHDVGGASWALNRRERGLELQREAYEGRKERYGAEHSETLLSAKQLAEMLLDTKDKAEGITMAVAILPLAFQAFGGSHEITNWAAGQIRSEEALTPGEWQSMLRNLGGEEPWPTDRTVQLIAKGGDWHYYDTGQPVPQWKQQGFNHAAWPAGSAPLGYGEENIKTTIGHGDDPDQKLPSACFRTTFSAPETMKLDKLRVKIRRDDGAAVYLNETLITSHHLENQNGEIANLDEYATATVGGLEETLYYTSDVDPSLLRKGQNVLSVQIHQCNGGSSDFFFDLSLEGLRKP